MPGIGLLGSLNVSGTPAPATVPPPGTLQPVITLWLESFFFSFSSSFLSSWARFGGFAAVCKAYKLSGTLLPQMKKLFQEALSVSETEKGNKGVFMGLWCVRWFLQLRACCECSLRHSSRIWCSRCVFGLCFILPQFIFAMIYEKNKGGQGWMKPGIWKKQKVQHTSVAFYNDMIKEAHTLLLTLTWWQFKSVNDLYQHLHQPAEKRQKQIST